ELMDWSRLYFFSGFAFNQLGLSWTFSFFPMQFAALGGVFFLSFWTILCNMLFLKLLLTVNKRKYSCLFTCFVAIPFIYGLINVKVQEAKIKESQHINVALIQTGLQIEEKSIMEKWIDAFIHPLDQWQRILAFLLTEKTQHPLDLIVLPEYALPFVDHLCIYSLEDVTWMLQQHIPSKDLKNTLPILKEPYAKQSNTGKWMVSNGYIAQFISNYFHANLILGLDTVNKKTNESYNAAFFFKPFEEHSEYYIKQKLLPLAEYMPLKLLEKISEGYGITSFFTPGNNAGIFEGEEYRYSPSICYEECFPHVIRKSRLLHPNILVNITNDGWYPFSNLPQVHFVHGKLRSVELGTSLVRSCNSGVTCALNPLGKVIDSLPILSNNQFYQGILYCSVPTYIYITPYVIWGDAFVLIISSLCVLFFAFPYRKKKNSSC
ncbi:MAG: apolipoprotein N-acyltransferase, partial [Chlamydiales bacterium]|nr:apolipoprotein N-acyltransferase [Chlamydiales bacterium]